MRTSVEDGLPGMSGSATFSVNNMGYRGDSLVVPKPPGEIRIFLVGGSTTECFYIDDSLSMNSIVQNELNAHLPRGTYAKVYNAGKSGNAIDDHISMMVHRIVHLQPDVVVVFAGINDLTKSIYHADPLHFVELDTLAPQWTLGSQLRFAATELQLSRRLYYLLKPLASKSPTEVFEEIPAKSGYRERVAIRKSAPRTDARPRVDGEAYRTNLRTLVGVAAAHNVALYLMTQQTTWNGPDPVSREWQWMLYRDGVVYRPDYMDEALESLNDRMREVAAAAGIPVYDLARLVPKTSEFFYDDVHFNVRGARMAGLGIASLMLKRGLPSPDVLP